MPCLATSKLVPYIAGEHWRSRHARRERHAEAERDRITRMAAKLGVEVDWMTGSTGTRVRFYRGHREAVWRPARAFVFTAGTGGTVVSRAFDYEAALLVVDIIFNHAKWESALSSRARIHREYARQSGTLVLSPNELRNEIGATP